MMFPDKIPHLEVTPTERERGKGEESVASSKLTANSEDMACLSSLNLRQIHLQRAVGHHLH